jgi:predicted metal-dependent hydrolase
VSKKSAKIQDLIESCQGKDLNPHYLGYFECFNAGMYYEAHDVLEAMWLPCRKEPRGNFYKGLIQVAGAFVHLQKNRLQPAAALFSLAASYLEPFAPLHEHLHVNRVLDLIGVWAGRLHAGNFEFNPLGAHPAPTLTLIERD